MLAYGQRRFGECRKPRDPSSALTPHAWLYRKTGPMRSIAQALSMLKILWLITTKHQRCSCNKPLSARSGAATVLGTGGTEGGT